MKKGRKRNRRIVAEGKRGGFFSFPSPVLFVSSRKLNVMSSAFICFVCGFESAFLLCLSGVEKKKKTTERAIPRSIATCLLKAKSFRYSFKFIIIRCRLTRVCFTEVEIIKRYNNLYILLSAIHLS